MEIRALHPLFAAEAVGVDLSQPLDEGDFNTLKAAFEQNSVLVIRRQEITPAQQVAFSRRLGELEIHVLRQFLHPDAPEILLVSNEKRDGKPIGLGDAGHYWHSDLSYKEEPSLGSALYARVLPRDGGDTLFASMHAAYDRLEPALRERLIGLTGVHDYGYRSDIQARAGTRPPLTEAQRAAVPPVEHPLVRLHDATGRPALFVNEGFTTRIPELPPAESDAFLRQLFAASVDPAVTYRHHWQPGDMVLWDNRAVIHLATGCPEDQARTLHRTTIKGARPVGAAQTARAA
ncbi:TauD/TfdA dioxygenase family protein [Roseomonas sp. BN140053]|uniref:TauD/TfdA dioxygenase family protein n=1 Tax=Roseomonas sp. BN140053 TaxID=3391898 RepID=UPI0039EAB641